MTREFLSQFGLSRSQLNAAEQVIKGKSNKEIAELLGIAERTVKFHLCAAYKKLKVKTRCQLILKAWEFTSGAPPRQGIV